MKHCRHPSKLIQLVEENQITFSKILLVKLSKNMSIALENMTESAKKLSYLHSSFVNSLGLD